MKNPGYYYNFGVVAVVVVVGRGDVVVDDGTRGDIGGDNVGFIKLPYTVEYAVLTISKYFVVCSGALCAITTMRL
jgi:hypothetical protein